MGYLSRFDADEIGDNVVCDPACFTVHQDESSRNVASETEVMMTRSPMPTSSDEAIRLAIKMAVGAGEFERATMLIGVLKNADVQAETLL